MNKNILFNIFVKTKCSVDTENSNLGTFNKNWISNRKLFLPVKHKEAESFLMEIQIALLRLEKF
jgi:hypothetical protein